MSGVGDVAECGGGAVVAVRRNGNYSRRSHRRNAPQEHYEIPEELVDPCKVYVSNLRRKVTERTLHEVFSHYVTVEKAIIIKDKHTKRSKGYGFVKVKTDEDVQKLLALPDSDRYIQGQQVTIRVAKKRVVVPGDDNYVRPALSDRDFDLESPEPDKPSIHMLVDDVMFKIMSYLPVRTLIKAEIVCRRWQDLVYKYFSKMKCLNINEEFLGLSPPFTKPIISKLLILSGPTLRSLIVQRADFATRQNILKVIGQLCPSLEYLDVSKARGINYLHISSLVKGCKNIKGFVAKNCLDFNDKALQTLLVSYPQLEKLDIVGTSVVGKNFHMLPATLKELYIQRVTDMCHNTRSTMSHIADRCPDLRVLEMKECMISKSELEYIGSKCLGLTKLAVHMPIDCSDILSSFTKLEDLSLVGDLVDLNKVFQTMSQLQVLSLDARDVVSEDVDFSTLEKLRSVKLYQTTLSTSSLETLAKCKHLEEIYLYRWHTLSEDLLLLLLKSCPKLKQVTCPSLYLSVSFVTKANEVVKERPGLVVIEARDTASIVRTAQFDKNKIQFINAYNVSYLYDPFGYDSDSDYSDGSFDASWYDSDIDFPDHYFMDEHDDFHDDLFEAAVMMAAWNLPHADLY